jgi:hypothetical protein
MIQNNITNKEYYTQYIEFLEEQKNMGAEDKIINTLIAEAEFDLITGKPFI